MNLYGKSCFTTSITYSNFTESNSENPFKFDGLIIDGNTIVTLYVSFCFVLSTSKYNRPCLFLFSILCSICLGHLPLTTIVTASSPMTASFNQQFTPFLFKIKRATITYIENTSFKLFVIIALAFIHFGLLFVIVWQILFVGYHLLVFILIQLHKKTDYEKINSLFSLNCSYIETQKHTPSFQH